MELYREYKNKMIITKKQNIKKLFGAIVRAVTAKRFYERKMYMEIIKHRFLYMFVNLKEFTKVFSLAQLDYGIGTNVNLTLKDGKIFANIHNEKVNFLKKV